MKALATIRVEAPSRLVELRGAAPVALRGDGCGTVWLVGAAAGPLGGDVVEIHVEVGAGARLRVRSVAAQLVQPGAKGGPATVRITATVGADGRLDWAPEPTVVAGGAELHQQVDLALAPSATVRWRDVLVLGRHGDPPGRVAARLRADVGATPLLRHEVVAGAGPGWDGPAGLAGGRAVAGELRVGGGADPTRTVAGDCRGTAPVVLSLDGGGSLTTAAGPDARGVIDALRTRCTAPRAAPMV